MVDEKEVLILKKDYEKLQEFIRIKAKQHKHKDDFVNAIMSKFKSIMYNNGELK